MFNMWKLCTCSTAALHLFGHLHGPPTSSWMSPTGTLATTNGSLSTNLSFAKELSLPPSVSSLQTVRVQYTKMWVLISKNPGKSRYSKEEEQHCQALMPLKHCEVRLCSQSTRPRGDCTVGMCSSLPHRHCPYISLLIFIYFLSYSLYLLVFVFVF